MPTNPRSSHKPRVHCSVDEIMRLEATGIRRAEIAERLEISQSSVDRIVIRERRKAGLAPPARRKADRPRTVERP
jgi:transposase